MKTELLPVNPPLTPPRRGTAKACPAACSPPLEGLGVGLVFRIATPETNLLWLLIAVLLSTTTQFVPAATNDLSSALQKGLFEEEANRDLDAAIESYQSLVGAFDKDRKIAATAVFRLGEVYRKQGRTNEAVAQYERIVQEFSDQTTLVTLSRQNIAGLGIWNSSDSAGAASRTAATRLGNASEEAKALADQLAGLEQLKDKPETQARAVLALFPDEDLKKMLFNLPLVQKQESEFKTNPNAYMFARAVGCAAEDLTVMGRLTDLAGAQKELKKQSTLIEQRVDFILSNQKARLQVLNAVAGTTTTPETAATEKSAPVTDSEDQEIRRIQAMIQNSPDRINAPWDGGTPLFNAASAGQLRVATFLLDHGADVNLKSGSGTPLHGATLNGHKAMVDLLLNRGADVNARDGTGASPLHRAAASGFLSVVETLLQHKADPNARNSRGNGEQTPLHLAAAAGHTATVKLLIAKGADVNAKMLSGGSPLLSAAVGGHRDTAAALLDAKADANAANDSGSTPLWAAANDGHLELARLLLERGADPDVGRRPLLAAIQNGHVRVVELLLAHKVDPNGPDNEGNAPLCAGMGNVEIVRLLLEAGANPNVRSKDGRPAILTAIDSASPAILKLLLDHKADVNVAGPYGWTALHSAVGNGKREMVESLLAHKADVNARMDDGETPLDLAKFIANRNQPQGPPTVPNRLPAPGTVSYQWTTVPTKGPATNEPPSLENLLRQHGALDDLPDFTTIRVTRQGLERPVVVFRAYTNGWNRFTLLETVTGFYAQSQVLVGYGSLPAANLAPFPDLTRIIIHRSSHTPGGKAQEMKINLLNVTNGVDCTKDMPLEFGDVVEIPARDYTLNEPQVGLTREQQEAIARCLQRFVRLVVRGQTREVVVLPRSSQDAWLKVLLQRPEAKSLLLSSSDLSRVKVTRKNPATGKATEFVVNTSAGGPDRALWLLDGDVIEVPEK